MTREERQARSAVQPKCHCGNCLSATNTTGRCASCEDRAKPSWAAIMAAVEVAPFVSIEDIRAIVAAVHAVDGAPR